MNDKLYFYPKILSLLLSRKFIPSRMIKDDYNLLAPFYDENFSNHIGLHSQELVRRMNIRNGASVLDLACGTGVITAELNKYIGQNGRLVAVDYSGGMIKVAKKKIGGNIEFIEGDIIKIIDTFQNDYYDYVTCGWAICYLSPQKILRKIRRILKQEGKVGIIENKRNTLIPLREAALKVMKRFPRHIQYLTMLPFCLPKDQKDFGKLFERSGLKPIDVWEGEVKFNFKSGIDVLNWSLRTGTGAGFNKVMDPNIRKECDEAFIEIIEKDYMTATGINISRAYVAGIARKT